LLARSSSINRSGYFSVGVRFHARSLLVKTIFLNSERKLAAVCSTHLFEHPFVESCFNRNFSSVPGIQTQFATMIVIVVIELGKIHFHGPIH
jgi:hypothetical protein